MSRRPQNMESDERNVDENNLQSSNSRSRQNVMQPEDESPYNTAEVGIINFHLPGHVFKFFSPTCEKQKIPQFFRTFQ